MKIHLIDLQYPYGKQRVHPNGSLLGASAQLIAQGYEVTYTDLNMVEELHIPYNVGDVWGISAYGAPYIPEAVAFARKYSEYDLSILVGGQAIEGLSREQFASLFAGTKAVQILSTDDVVSLCGEATGNKHDFSLRLAFMNLSERYLDAYLRVEIPLWISQGCVYGCYFCAAKKRTEETFVRLYAFEETLEYLVSQAQKRNIDEISFYASSLDFFQNPQKIEKFLIVIRNIQETSGVKIRLRSLSCMKSFLRAKKEIPNFGELLKQSGMEAIGFGVDGADVSVWKSQGKNHNKQTDVEECLEYCTRIGIQPEVLLVMGFPEDTLSSLVNNVISAARYVRRWPQVMLRPYLAKSFVPGNDDWKNNVVGVEVVLDNFELFYNLDFSAIGSSITHPRRWHRYASNTAYLTIIGVFTLLGKCDTPPLLPQGESGIYGKFSRLINRYIPADK